MFMRYQDESYKEILTKEMLQMEAEIHDLEYSNSLPFMSSSLKIEVDHVWRINDLCYKKGRYIRGYRKRRLFELMDLDNIKGKKVLDVGCGNGQHAVFFAMHGANVHAFDISEVGVKIGRKIAEANGVSNRCHFSVQSASNIAYNDETFDIIVYNAVLHHVLKYPNVKSETLRVLRKGGYVFFADGIRVNPVYRTARHIFRSITGRRPKGDVDLYYEDILQFAQAFSKVHIESFCFLLGIKALIGRPINNSPLVRCVFYFAKRMDDVLLKVFPFFHKYCSEVVGKLEK